MPQRTFFTDQFQPSFGVPWIPVLSKERMEAMTEEALRQYALLRQTAERNARENPVKWGWILPSWETFMEYFRSYAIHVIMGGNRAAKSTLAARTAVWCACTIPEAEVRMYHVNEDRSIEDQQRFIWEAIPDAIKNLPTTRGKSHSIQYSQKNGFADGICIFPPIAGYRRGGYIKFGNYRQYQQDPQVAEGFKAHLIVLDEEAPEKLVDTLSYRLTDYHGRMLMPFTTLQGWTPLIQDILGRTRTIKKRHAPLVNRELPTLQESLSRPGMLIHYHWTEDNVFIDAADFLHRIKGRPKEEILARAYGIPTKSIQGVFPGFDPEVNVVPHKNLPWLNLKKDGNGAEIPYPTTRYMALDPAGSKNWFMLWVAIDAGGTWWVYREWPDYEDWALPGPTVEGKPGPAQKGSKRGIKDYVDLIKHCEGGEDIYERLIDPRLGAAQKQSLEGATTIISDLDDAGMTFIPAPGVDIDNGLQLINNLFAYDEAKPIDSLNAPKIYISDACPNLIYALKEYTAKGGSNEACKDPVDCLRYLAVSNIEFYTLKDLHHIHPTGVY